MTESYYIIPMTEPPYSRDNPKRPLYVDEIRCNWTGHNVDLLGIFVCLVNTTELKHTDLSNRIDVYRMPQEYSWNTIISDMHAAARNFIRNLCENRLIIPYSTSDTLGELLMRIINSGLFELGSTPIDTQFQNLSIIQQNKILNLFIKFNLSIPNSIETVKEISNRSGRIIWPGDDRTRINVREF